MPRHIAPPSRWLSTLTAIFGEDVSRIRIVEHSLYARCHGPIQATTRPEKILLCGSWEAFFADPGLVLHEYFHVVRQWRTGELTRIGYLRECGRHGYWHNRFEVEAREFAARELVRCRTLLGSRSAEPG